MKRALIFISVALAFANVAADTAASVGTLAEALGPIAAAIAGFAGWAVIMWFGFDVAGLAAEQLYEE